MRAYFNDRNRRRMFLLALFLVLLWVFRHLAVLLVFFVLFERSLGTGARFLRDRWRVPLAVGVLAQVLLALAAVTGLAAFGVAQVLPRVPSIQHDLQAQFQHLLSWVREHHLLGGHVDAEQAVERGQHYAGSVLTFVAATGRNLVYALLGLILAVVYTLEQRDLEAWYDALPADSPPSILLGYFGHVCEAITITAKLQVVVAVVNTLITLPVLLALGLPSIPALLVFMVVLGLIPVVGGFVSGGVLAALAYVHKGPVGVVVFLVSTFVLHKIESYYLTPKLTARHIKLPGFVIITSLLLFEHVFGLAGLFLSFPALYVAAKIKEGNARIDEPPEGAPAQ
ncbi:MAG: AI-2E family transporter [Deltaproteobacteria bacterium]|nr:AI-2E family transporter [Deltaproteobacteria bacterium]